MSDELTSHPVRLPLHTTCPFCGQVADKTDWLPPPGYDPILREYVCSHCHYAWYHVPKHGIPFPTPADIFKPSE